MLDDLDSRPGSATSLLRTIVGAFLRELGGWSATADLVDLLADVGVGPPSARSAISRVKAKGLLDAEEVAGRPGYRVAPGALGMLERGDRRIYGYRRQGEDDPWCLVSYSVPESRRDERHRLRRHLQAIGCGSVATGLWICPGHLVDEVESILRDLGLREHATVFVTGTPRVAGSFARSAARWWDLERVARRHREFLERFEPAAAAPPEPREAFAVYTRALDAWRPLPYLDPGLPPAALPGDWPGRASLALFGHLHSTLRAPAVAHVTAVTSHPPS